MTERAGVCVADTNVGRGVFATRDFAAGEVILAFTGAPLSYEDTLTLSPQDEARTLQIDSGRYIDTEPPGRYTNHSCDPNSGVVEDKLVALRPVLAREEIRFDYSTTMGLDDLWTMDCVCGAPLCRGTIRAFATLPATLKEHYTRLGIVPAFLLREPERREETFRPAVKRSGAIG